MKKENERDTEPTAFQIRANFNRETICIYQAYSAKIAEPALGDQKFSGPFSFSRMTWIKPSFLWLMERSAWGKKSGQEKTLRVRITREGWEKALSLGVLTNPVKAIHKSPELWQKQFDQAQVHIQWDPERSLRGEKLDRGSIQVGLSRSIIQEFNDNWIREIKDMTPLVHKIVDLKARGKYKEAERLLPPEKVYPIPEEIATRICGA